ncbi:MAG: UvrD-helicase domain-containing protein, partial [Gemmatimonadaceae bacterium]|nr:UvrD-helicase domain-containing protein [Caulobacter sp.]
MTGRAANEPRADQTGPSPVGEAARSAGGGSRRAVVHPPLRCPGPGPGRHLPHRGRIFMIDPQRVAADPTISAFVSANAGSGKTKTLIDRVARLLLAGSTPEAILCVT